MNILLSKIQNRKIKIGVIGLGYVGLPLIIRFAEKGFKTTGFDIDKNKIKKLNENNSYISHINNKKIVNARQTGFFATNNFNKIADIDAVIICVPTPLGIHNEPNLSYVENTLKTIKPYVKQNQLIILESTTYPGTTEEILVPFFNDLGFIIGKNFFIGYSPEREDPGNKKYNTKTIPKIVSGHTKVCLNITTALYDQIVDSTVPVSSTKVAEMTKILENIYRAVNIGLINEVKMVADKMDIDIYEVIKAASTKPFGFTPYYPGPGLGGHCIPIDPFYLTWKAKEIGMNTRFIELAGEINTAMPQYVVQKISDSLNSVGQSIKGSKILVLGLSYKKNVDDLRESPSLKIIHILNQMGANVQFSDPFFKKIPPSRKFKFDLESKKLNAENIKKYALVLIATDHDSFDYELIQKNAKIIVDTRGRLTKYPNVVIS